MSGIVVLNVTTVSKNSTTLLVALIFLMFGALFNTLLVLKSDNNKDCILHGIFASVLLILAVIVGVVMDNDKKANTHNQYECLIDSSVSLEDVYEQYTVVERRGEIWVLEDKQIEKDD